MLALVLNIDFVPGATKPLVTERSTAKSCNSIVNLIIRWWFVLASMLRLVCESWWRLLLLLLLLLLQHYLSCVAVDFADDDSTLAHNDEL